MLLHHLFIFCIANALPSDTLSGYMHYKEEVCDLYQTKHQAICDYLNYLESNAVFVEASQKITNLIDGFCS
jgi:hypothetical protein